MDADVGMVAVRGVDGDASTLTVRRCSDAGAKVTGVLWLESPWNARDKTTDHRDGAGDRLELAPAGHAAHAGVAAARGAASREPPATIADGHRRRAALARRRRVRDLRRAGDGRRRDRTVPGRWRRRSCWSSAPRATCPSTDVVMPGVDRDRGRGAAARRRRRLRRDAPDAGTAAARSPTCATARCRRRCRPSTTSTARRARHRRARARRAAAHPRRRRPLRPRRRHGAAARTGRLVRRRG